MALVIYDRPIILDSTGQTIADKLDDIATIMENDNIIDDSSTATNKTWSAQKLNSDFSSITEKIPSGASSSNKMATASDITDINNKIPSNASSSNKMAVASDITNITEKIPSGASSSNKLATASDISDINSKIPANASSSNKLATVSDVSAAYRPSGNATLATLPALTEANLNRVYNMTQAFTTTSDFAEGAGIEVEVGNEVGIIDVSSTSTPDIKYTVLGGFIDTSGLQPKTLDTPITVDGTQKTTVETALSAINTLAAGVKTLIGNLANLTTTAKDSVVNAINELVSSISTINGKIPSNATTTNQLVTASDVDLGLVVENGKLCVRYEK